MFTRSILLAVGAASLALLSSCATRTTGGGMAGYHAYDVPTKLPGNTRIPSP